MDNKKIRISLIVLLLVFAVVCTGVLTESAKGLNDFIYCQVVKTINPLLTSIMKIIADMGEWFVYIPFALLFLILPKIRQKIGVPAASVLAVSATGNSLIKLLFQVARPDVDHLISVTGYGFPSGHVMNGTAFVGICAYLFCRYTHKKHMKIIVAPVSVLFLLLMGFDRVYLGVHSATDVAGGYLCGSIIVLATVMIINARAAALISNQRRYH